MAASVAEQIAAHLKAVYFGGNWTSVNLKDQLADVTWEQATCRVGSFHTLVAQVYHMNYFVAAVLKVLRGGPLDSHDKFSFDHPPIGSQEDWQRMLEKVWSEVEEAARLIEQLPDKRLAEDFVDGKYGNYYRNLQGVVEHCHYHLGQLVLTKKMLADRSS